MKRSDIIRPYIHTRDWTGMTKMLDNLSNSEFRKMETAVRTVVLQELDNDLFWETLLYLIIYKRPAFIAGAAACEHLIKNDTINFKNVHMESLYKYLEEFHPESIVKLANIVLHLLKKEKLIYNLFDALHIDNDVSRISILLKEESVLSYFLIFKSLKMMDDRLIASKCCSVIMKRGNDMAFNFVSLVKTYWDLTDIPARFSLNIEEYELNHIDRSFDNFEHIMNGKRPKLNL